LRGGLVASAMLLPPVSHKNVRRDIWGISDPSEGAGKTFMPGGLPQG
jgi:hypothetical protein